MKDFKDRIIRLQKKLEKLLNKEFPEIMKEEVSPVSFLVMVKDNQSGLAGFTGSGCAVCAIEQSIKWVIENNFTHEDGRPFIPPVALVMKPTRKSEVN